MCVLYLLYFRAINRTQSELTLAIQRTHKGVQNRSIRAELDLLTTAGTTYRGKNKSLED